MRVVNKANINKKPHFIKEKRQIVPNGGYVFLKNFKISIIWTLFENKCSKTVSHKLFEWKLLEKKIIIIRNAKFFIEIKKVKIKNWNPQTIILWNKLSLIKQFSNKKSPYNPNLYDTARK